MSKDILLFMSDQHSYALQGYAGDRVVRTGMLDELARRGTVMTEAMAPCPLCVPSRASMISGLLPSNNGVLFNFSSLNSNQATFLHSLTVSGYDTVLCGRMHFVGPDQRHGFGKRIAGDKTPVFHNPAPRRSDEGGEGVRGYDENSSLYYMGPGNSPVLEYDRYVVDKALKYLSEDHEKPQFLTVGVYGPHFPYVAPPELYEYYHERVSLRGAVPAEWEHPALYGKMCETDPSVVRAARAAYYGLVEQNDRNVETVYRAFQAYLKRTGHEGIFIYVSDHGDMNGDRGYYGKQVFYDRAVHIPFLIQGDGIPEGKVISSPVSLMDLGPTVCELAGAEILPGDGRSIVGLIRGAEPESAQKVRYPKADRENGFGNPALQADFLVGTKKPPVCKSNTRENAISNVADSDAGAGAESDIYDGDSTERDAAERMVVSEQYTYLAAGGSSLGRMVRYRNWKFISYSGFEDKDILFDMEKDPGERVNVIKEHPDIAEKIRNYLDSFKTYDEIMVHEKWMMKQQKLLMKCNFDDERERFICPHIELLKEPVRRKEDFKPTAWVGEMRRQINEA